MIEGRDHISMSYRKNQQTRQENQQAKAISVPLSEKYEPLYDWAWMTVIGVTLMAMYHYFSLV